MARVYSVQLAEAPGAVGSVDLFTVPGGHVYVIRHITMCHEATPPATNVKGFRLRLTPSFTTVWSVLDRGLVAGRSYDWAGRHVARSGETLLYESGTEEGWDILVSGYDLELP